MFAVSLDPRLVSSVEVVSAQLNHRPFSKRISRAGAMRTESVFRTHWHALVRLAAGDVLDEA